MRRKIFRNVKLKNFFCNFLSAIISHLIFWSSLWMGSEFSLLAVVSRVGVFLKLPKYFFCSNLFYSSQTLALSLKYFNFFFSFFLFRFPPFYMMKNLSSSARRFEGGKDGPGRGRRCDPSQLICYKKSEWAGWWKKHVLFCVRLLLNYEVELVRLGQPQPHLTMTEKDEKDRKTRWGRENFMFSFFWQIFFSHV